MRPELTANINRHKHGFVSEMQTLITANIPVNEFIVFFLLLNLDIKTTYVVGPHIAGP